MHAKGRPSKIMVDASDDLVNRKVGLTATSVSVN